MLPWLKEEDIETLGTSQRRSLILETLKKTNIVRVSNLSQFFGVTMVTIRRDLDILEKQGHLKRIHGGAVPVQSFELSELFGRQGEDKSLIKEKIGRAGAELISKSENIIIDSGTTPLHVVKNISYDLLDSGNLSIITNSLPVYHELKSEKGIHLIFLGGLYVPEYEVVVGPQTIDHIRTLYVDKMFLGTDGLTFSKGITTANVLEAEVSQEMVKVANEVIVVSDSSKIGKKGLASIVSVTKINKLITDKNAPEDFIEQLKDNGVDVMLV
jgi:DeoR family transcriptional regulator, fructose operon transcriptional repressor